MTVLCRVSSLFPEIHILIRYRMITQAGSCKAASAKKLAERFPYMLNVVILILMMRKAENIPAGLDQYMMKAGQTILPEIYHSNRGCKDNRFRFEKKQSNIVVRNYEGEIHKGGAYKKIYEYWWFIDECFQPWKEAMPAYEKDMEVYNVQQKAKKGKG